MIYVNPLVIFANRMRNEDILNQETLEEIVETSVDAIIVINNRGIIQYVNRATLFLFLYQRQDLIGQNVSVLMPEPDQSRHDGYLESYRHTGEKKIIGIGREVKALKKSGEVFACLLSLSEVNVGGVQYFTGIIHDISALKQAEVKLLELNKSLEAKVAERTDRLGEVVNRLLETNTELTQEVQLRKNAENALKESENELIKLLNKEKELGELKSRFVTMASHEFRTPLSTILSSTNLVAKYVELDDAEKIEGHLFKIKDNIAHLTSILNDFLSMGKWDEGKVKVEKTSFCWQNFITDLVDSMKDVLKDGQTIELSIQDHQIYLDKNLLKKSLINLIANAIKYSNENSSSLVSSSLEDDIFHIAVKDDGIGIPVKEQHSIFERFYRASNVTNIQGTGIGLNLVRNYVTTMDGEITFESEESKGACFNLKFKLNEDGK